MHETLLVSSIILKTLDQFAPTSVIRPTSPPPAKTFIPTFIPSLEPLSIIKVENQLPVEPEITLAPVLG